MGSLQPIGSDSGLTRSAGWSSTTLFRLARSTCEYRFRPTRTTLVTMSYSPSRSAIASPAQGFVKVADGV